MSSTVVTQPGRAERPKPGGDGMTSENRRASSAAKGASASAISSLGRRSSGRPLPRLSISSSTPPAVTRPILRARWSA